MKTALLLSVLLLLVLSEVFGMIQKAEKREMNNEHEPGNEGPSQNKNNGRDIELIHSGKNRRVSNKGKITGQSNKISNRWESEFYRLPGNYPSSNPPKASNKSRKSRQNNVEKEKEKV